MRDRKTDKDIFMALIGYARVSTTDQNLELQVDALKSAGCETVFEDVISGVKAERPGLNDALDFLRRGDTLVVWKLDRLGRSMKHLVETVTALGDRRVGFRSLTEGVDTTTTGAAHWSSTCSVRLPSLSVISLSNAHRPGLKAATMRGRKGGRKPVVNHKKLEQTRAHISDGLTVREAAARLKVSKTSLYKALRDQKPN